MRFSIPFYVLLSISCDCGVIGIDNRDRVNIDERFLKTIAHHYCDRLTGTHVVLLAEKSAASFYKVLLRSFKTTFYTHNSLVGNFTLSDYYVIHIEDERFFLLEDNYDQRFWHTTKTYLIVSDNRLKINLIWTHIQRLWKTFGVFKISVLHMDDLKVLRIFDKGFYKYVGTRSLNYGLKNVKKYPLRAVVFPRVPSIIYHNGKWTGPDWETMQSFTKIMNFSLELIVISDQIGFGSMVNGSYTGVLAEVVNGRADLSFNSRFLNDPMIDKAYRYSYINGLDFICFVVPRADPQSKMHILWKTFTVEVWLCLAVTYVLMTKSFGLFNEYNVVGGRTNSDPFMTSIQVVLGMGVYVFPKHEAGRLLLVSCSAACFVVVTLFQASMVTKLSIEKGHNEIDTLEDLDRSGMEIRTSLESVRDSLAMYSYTRSLAEKIDLQKDRRDYAVSKFVFTARIMSLNVMEYLNYVSHWQNDSFELHVVRECPLKYYLAYPVTLDFPFLNELNDIIIRFQEAGISNKWRKDIQKFEHQYYKPMATNTSKALKAYSLNDLWFAFVFLFVGYTISTVVLMFEFILKKIQK